MIWIDSNILRCIEWRLVKENGNLQCVTSGHCLWCTDWRGDRSYLIWLSYQITIWSDMSAISYEIISDYNMIWYDCAISYEIIWECIGSVYCQVNYVTTTIIRCSLCHQGSHAWTSNTPTQALNWCASISLHRPTCHPKPIAVLKVWNFAVPSGLVRMSAIIAFVSHQASSTWWFSMSCLM